LGGEGAVAQKYKIHLQNAPFKKKLQKNFFPEGPRENVTPGLAVALDGPADP